ncbi:MAG TPA: erythrose-4-phosphate dehydrogenase, partial [Alphaproteobacteria bacterium]|nr:erythrose-4-phosphate dehydrogenase [Alphaproteobacteria bacterium]
MTIKVAINGFGRIGRLVMRSIIESGRSDIEVVAINDLASVDTNAHLLKYDSVHGRCPADISAQDGKLMINGKAIQAYAERDPANLPWGDLGVDVAMECTGIFTARDAAAKHLEAGAKKVLIS